MVELKTAFHDAVNSLTLKNASEKVSDVWMSDTGAYTSIDHAVIKLDDAGLVAEESELYGSNGCSIVTVSKDGEILARFFHRRYLLDELVNLLEEDYVKGSSLVAGADSAIECARSDNASSNYHPVKLGATISGYTYATFDELLEETIARNGDDDE